MNILIFSDPFIENNKPLLRYEWADFFIKNIVSKINFSIQSEGQTTDIVFFGNEALSNKLKRNQNDNLSFKFIPKDKLGEWTHERSLEIYKSNQENSQKAIELAELTASAIGDDWRPDFIISLTPADWLSTYYKCEHIFYEAGLFSRAPFPGLTQWDPYPDHWHAGFVSKNFEELKKITNDNYLSPSRKRILDEIRSLYKQGLRKKYDRKHLNINNEYEFLVLLPLQFSSSIAFDSCCEYGSQVEFLEDVLNRIDPRIGVVVTTHNFYENPLTQEIDNNLKKKYKNYIRLPAFNHDAVASQELLLEVDAVIAVSTAVSLQALFWNKPVFTVGNSYMKSFSISCEVEYVFDFLKKESVVDNDAVTYWLLVNYYIPLSLCLEENKLYRHFLNLIDLKNEKVSLRDFVSVFNEFDVIYSLIKNFKKENIIPSDRILIEKESIFIDSIKNHDLISFDIFDTLLERPFAKPSHLFAFMQKDVEKILAQRAPACFMSARIYAENEVARKSTNKEDVTLDEIYVALQNYLSIDEKASEIIKNLEIELEIKYALPREFIRKIFDLSIISKKRLILISDMYLPKYVIEEMLGKCDYFGYSEIYLSCEIYKTKSTSSLYEYVEKIEGFSRENWLHIGDNLRADINNTRNMGIRSLYAPKAVDRFLEYPKAKKIFFKFFNNKSTQFYYENFISNSLVMGLLSRKIASNPYYVYNDLSQKPDFDSLSLGKTETFGYIYGPMFLGFSKWVLDQARKHKVKHLLFLSRDGYFPFEIFKRFNVNDVSASYLYCSRKTIYLASVRSYSDILDVVKNSSFSKGTIKSFFLKKFDIEIDSKDFENLRESGFSGLTDEISQRQGFEVDQRLQLFLNKMSERILEKAELFRRAFFSQIKNSTDVDFNNIGLVDIGCSTSMQFYLQKLLGERLAHGLYFIKNHISLQYSASLDSSGYLSNCEDQNISRSPYFDNIEFFETIFSAPHGSVNSFEFIRDQVHPVYLEDSCIKKKEFSEEFHKGVLNFVDDFLQVSAEKFDELNFSLGLSLNLQYELIINPGAKDAMCLDEVEFENDFGGFLNTKIINYSKSNFSANEIVGKSVWKPGARAIFQYISKSHTESNPDISKKNHRSISIDDNNLLKSKKMRKLKNNPYLFFKDSKNKYMKCISYFIPKNLKF